MSCAGVMVMYTSEHNGHDKALKHITLSQIEKQRIAGMISAGIEFDEILDTIRDNLSPTEITRLHLIKRRDLKNISRQFHLRQVKHKDGEGTDPERDRKRKMLLKAGCGAPNNKEKNLRVIEELINTIRGSLVDDPRHDVLGIAKEALKAAVGQITAASLRPAIQPGAFPYSQNINEPVNKPQDKQVRTEGGKTKNPKRKRQPRKKLSESESLAIARAWEGQELFLSCEPLGDDHGYDMDGQQQFGQQSDGSRKSEKS